jgi:hypothetical protein
MNMKSLAASALAVVGALLLGACTSASNTSGNATPATPSVTHSSSPGTTATASAATCKHVASLRSSLDSLTHIQLNASASKQIRTNLTNIKTQLTTLKTENTGALSTQVSQLSTELNQVEKAAQGVSANPTAAQFQAIITALSALKSTSKATVDKMTAMCPHS